MNKKSASYAFIDSQNLNMTIQKLGWKMDWKKFRRFLADNYNVSKAFMFIGYVPEQEDMYQSLHEAGYVIVLKPTYDMTRPRTNGDEDKPKSGEDKKPIKGNVDSDLVLWVMKEMPNYGKAVIVTGDGDFYSLIEYLDEQGKLLKLLAPSHHYSRLFNRFDKYIERIDQHRRELSYGRVRSNKKS